ncbi:VanZ family protein [Neptunicella sp.]|uniref:VanZ family protein n=1 Tax=Neptunicella sp. TaxID=2125986 RepID=UPI003F694510
MQVESGTYKFILGCAVVYSIFVIYGSLVPLEYHYIPFSEAVRQFKAIPYLQLDIHSRADWVANGLLFFPLSYLWMSFFILNRPYSHHTTALLMIVVYIASAVLAACIEFTQLYFPQRTVSQNDIMAEFIGGGIGVTVWKFTYHRFFTWLDNWFQTSGGNHKWRNLLFLYVAGVFIYSVMPLDLYLSPIELYHKWKEGRINILPFATFSGSALLIAYEILTDIMLWIPLAILTLLYKPLSYRRVWWTVVLVATGIELCQLFVYSRSTDVTDVITAGIGAAIGLYLYQKYISPQLTSANPDVTSISTSKSIMWLSGAAWMIVLLLVYWYPFNWQINQAELSAKLDGFFSVPFKTYYFTSEYNALTRLLQKVLIAMPFGVWIAYVTINVQNKSLRWLVWAAGAGLFLLLEFGQVLIPEKTANSTDVLLAWGGLFLGGKLMQLLSSRPKPNVIHENNAQTNRATQPTNDKAVEVHKTIHESKLTNSWVMGLVVIILAVILSWLLNLSAVPYNIKELVAGDFRWLRLVGLVLCGFWVFGLPLAIVLQQHQPARHAANNAVIKQRLPIRPEFWILIHTLVAWLLVRVIFPLESIHDILGSPVWGRLPEIEMLYRFVGLFLLFSVALFYSSGIVLKLRYAIQVRHLHMLLLLVIAMAITYLVVIHFAATDNLIELFKYQGRSFYSVFIALYFILLLHCGLVLTMLRKLNSKGKAVSTLFILCSAPLGYWLLQLGLESVILKYGKVFSAMQFLFSADREHYLPAQELMVRFFIVHYVLIGFIAVTQTHPWLTMANRIGLGKEK